MYLPIPYKIFYDTAHFDLRSLVQQMLGADSLETLHLLEQYDLLNREKDQSTVWHRKYYDHFAADLSDTYVELIRGIKDSFGYKKIIYQKVPTFRVQLAGGNVAVGEWHKDKSYNHGVSEVNFWLPFMSTNTQNPIWMESAEDAKDFRAYEVNYGEVLVFSGANLTHGNVPNTSSETRVSIDFRLVDPDKFVSSDSGSINMNIKFEIGGYFDVM